MTELKNIKQSRRGLALVINNIKFNHLDEERPGAELDAQSIEILLNKLDFELVIKNDLSREEIKTVVNEYATMDHSNTKCFLCFVMSYAHGNRIEGVDGESISIEQVYQPFMQVEQLKDTPKLFFINLSPPLNEIYPLTNPDGTCDRLYEPNLDQDSNTLLHYSTVFGRDIIAKDAGSRFIQILVTRLTESKENLVDILTEIDGLLSRISSAGHVQSFKSTLRDEFVL